MKSKFIFVMLAATLFSCSENKTNETTEPEAEAQEMQTMSLEGKWRLVDYAGETEMGVVDSLDNYYLQFNESDSTFGLNTDCNSMGGEYKIVGDSLIFDNIACTQMACPDEKIERAMTNILPMIDTYVITPDSMLMLRSDARTMARFSYVKE